MKKLLLFSLPLCILTCTGNIQVVKDDFKNASIVTMKIKESSDESIFEGGGNAIFTYSREIKNHVALPTVISLHITKGKLTPLAGYQDLEKKAIVKVNDTAHEIPLTEISAVDVTTITGQPDFSTGSTRLTSMQYEEWNTKIILTPAIEEAVKNCTALAVRLYFGTSPMTFTLGKGSIEKFKEFLATAP